MELDQVPSPLCPCYGLGLKRHCHLRDGLNRVVRPLVHGIHLLVEIPFTTAEGLLTTSSCMYFDQVCILVTRVSHNTIHVGHAVVRLSRVYHSRVFFSPFRWVALDCHRRHGACCRLHCFISTQSSGSTALFIGIARAASFWALVIDISSLLQFEHSSPSPCRCFCVRRSWCVGPLSLHQFFAWHPILPPGL